jgi:hypothetical protein
MNHASLADVRLKSLIADVRTRLLEKAPPRITQITTDSQGSDDQEELNRMERERQKTLSDLVDRVKDLEVEVVCARGREEEAQKLVEEFAKERAQERYVGSMTVGLRADGKQSRADYGRWGR